MERHELRVLLQLNSPQARTIPDLMDVSCLFSTAPEAFAITFMVEGQIFGGRPKAARLGSFAQSLFSRGKFLDGKLVGGFVEVPAA